MRRTDQGFSPDSLHERDQPRAGLDARERPVSRVQARASWGFIRRAARGRISQDLQVVDRSSGTVQSPQEIQCRLVADAQHVQALSRVAPSMRAAFFLEGGKRKRAHRPTRCRDHQTIKVEARIPVPDNSLRHILSRFDLENERWSPRQPASLASCMTGPAWRRGPRRVPARTPLSGTRPLL
jgi:hypothetical protein